MKSLLPELLIMVLLLPATASAQSGEEIVLRADRARIDQKAGTGVYEGNAEMQQGVRHLTAETINIQLKNGEISRVEALGDPVRLTEGEALNAHARRLVYEIDSKMIHLFEEAFVSHEGRTFEGAQVRYDLRTRQVEASGDEKDRVRLVIPGEKTKEKAKENAKEKDTGKPEGASPP